MDRDAARALLTAVAGGALDVDAALAQLEAGPFAGHLAGYQDLGFSRVDTNRALRTGDPEVVYGAGKTPEQVIGVVSALRKAHPDRAALVTRTDEEMRAGLRAEFVDEQFDEVVEGRCMSIGPLPSTRGTVIVVSAG